MKRTANVPSKKEKNLQPFSRHESSPDPSVTRNTVIGTRCDLMSMLVLEGVQVGHMRFVTEEIVLLSIKKK